PFNNYVVTQTLTGAQVKSVLEQQFCSPTRANLILQVSAGLTYTWSESAACGSKVSNLQLNGTPIDPAASYRVTMNSFLADGGDCFPEFKNGTNRVFGGLDIDALTDYLG